jgi:hypothetical protein
MFKTKWYNSPATFLAIVLLSYLDYRLLFLAGVVFLLHCKQYYSMVAFLKKYCSSEEKFKERQFEAENKLLKTKLEINDMINRANNKKAALEIEILELKKEAAELTASIIEKTKESD